MRIKKTKVVIGFELGLILNMLAVSISLICKELLKIDSSNITNLIFIVSIVLVVDWNSILNNSRIRLSKPIIGLLLLQFYILILAIIKGAAFLGASDSLAYTIYVIAFIFAILTNRRNIDDESFLRILVIITALLNLITFALIVGGVTDLSSVRVTKLENGAERTTLSGIPFAFIAAFISYKPQTMVKKLGMYFVLLISIYNMLACNRRSIYVTVLLCLAFWLYKNYVNIQAVSREKALKLFVRVLFIIILFCGILSIDWVNYMFWKSFESLQSGILTFFGSDANDASVMVRNANRLKAYSDLKNNNIVQWIFGRGYAYSWIDFPIIEAYLDLGIIAGTTYLYLCIIFVLKNILKKRDFSGSEMFIIFNMLAVVVSSVTSGMPYGFTKYCPLTIFIYAIKMQKKEYPIQELRRDEDEFCGNLQ